MRKRGDKWNLRILGRADILKVILTDNFWKYFVFFYWLKSKKKFNYWEFSTFLKALSFKNVYNFLETIVFLRLMDSLPLQHFRYVGRYFVKISFYIALKFSKGNFNFSYNFRLLKSVREFFSTSHFFCYFSEIFKAFLGTSRVNFEWQSHLRTAYVQKKEASFLEESNVMGVWQLFEVRNTGEVGAKWVFN